MSRIQFSTIPLAVLALTIGTGALHATATIAASPSTLALACDTLLGPTPATVAVTLVTPGSAVLVTVTAPGGAPVVIPSAANTGTSFSFSVAAGCKGATVGTSTVVFTLTPATGTGITITATLTVTNSGSALAPSPSAVTITCTKSGSTYTPGAAQTVNVTTPANFGTPFTVDHTVAVLPSWLLVTPLTGGTAAAAPVALSIVAAAGCGALPVGSTTFSVHLLNAPAPDKLLPVTIQIGAAASLAASVSPVALSYTKGSLTYTPVTTNISSSPAVFFSVDPTTLPLWLNATPTTGTTNSPVTLSFVPTAGAETLALGSYSANVHLKASGSLDFVLPVTLQVKNPAATLTVAEGITRNINWTLGTTLPSLIITPISSDSPIAYTITTTTGTLFPQVASTQGLAYSFGTPISVTFLQSVFGAAAPGAALSGHVIFTPTVGSAVDVTITVNVKSPGASISGLTPSSLPTATSGTFTVVLSGSGFVSTGGASAVTKVGVVTGGSILSDTNITATVVNSTEIALSIAVPSSTDPFLPFSGVGGSVIIGVCNPQGSTCSVPSATVTLIIGINPIVQAVTSASSYVQATAPTLTSVAAYDILSVFGTNFCVSSGTGCTAGGSSAILYGTTDPVTLRYLTALTPDTTGTPRNLSVTFQTHGSSPTAIAAGALLFATNNQINVVVPDAVKAYIGNTVDIVVSFGFGSGATMLKSAPFSVSIAATNPGIFTVGGDGQGDAAALLPNYTLVTTANAAGARTTGTDSDIIQLYVTGLGVPDSVDGSAAWPGVTCMLLGDYWASVNASTSVSPALISNDGLVVQSVLFPTGFIQPCIKSSSANVPTVMIGSIAGVVKYAGWVADSVAGLYQINVQLPASGSAFVDATGTTGPALGTVLHLPIVVTAAGKTSQPSGVNISVVQRILLTASGQVTGANGSVWTGSAVLGTEGTSTYSYAVTGGTLPVGLVLNSDGTITGTPTAAGTSTVIFTGTDSTGLTGTASITFVIT